MSGAARRPGSETMPLPLLRTDLEFKLVAERGRGYPSLVVTDSVRGSYFRLSWPESGILLHWREASSVEELIRILASTYGTATDTDEIAAVVNFAFTNQLTLLDQAGSWHRYASILSSGHHGWLKSAIHGYLFFRIPLVQPEHWLQEFRRRVAFVFSRTFWIALTAMAVLGAYLATRQWTALVSAAHDALRLEGLATYAAVILGLKAIHELGHATATVRFGCRVPSMGVAFMLGAPVLYTDTSDSWRLAKRSERLTIVFAGVAAELIVATVAILMWSFLPDGIQRQICFALATTSVTLSLAVNLNPFMRFDGYFALSDWLGIPNLQSRAFALMAWKVRELLFDLRHLAPEQLPARMQRTLIAYAFATTIYRLGLYLGIALVVYAMAGKALGIILGLFEVVVFIALPIVHEVAAWWGMRSEIVLRRRVRATVGSFAIVGALLFIPWMTTIEAPGLLTAEKEEAIYLPFAARLASIGVTEGQQIEAGEILFTADTIDLEQQRIKALLEYQALAFQVRRMHANDKEREGTIVVESKLLRAREKLAAIERQQNQLVIRAPFSGKVVDLDPDISAGLWLNQKHPLARLVSTEGARVRGLVADTEVAQVARGSRGVFIPDDAAVARSPVIVVSVASGTNGRLSEPILADRYGGTVQASEERGELKVRQGWFEVELQAMQPAPAQQMRGVVRIETEGISPVVLIWRQVMRVLIREHGF